MARATLDILRDFPVHGIVVAPKGEKIGTFNKRIQVFRSGHPIPDRDGLEASKHVIQTVKNVGEDELLLCLISGGASAMLPAPSTGITLQDKKRVTEALVKSKATIHEINAVRRHLSTLKGGRLVELCDASTILSLIISDVPGNPLADIASGLTVEDPTTYQDAIQILRTHGLWNALPSRVVDRLTKGLNGVFPETPKPGHPAFHRVHNLIVADNRTACMAARQALKSSGITAEVLTSTAEMEANSMGRLLASIAVSCEEHEEPIVDSGAIIIGGETTVEVRGEGIGGRNQETALWAVDSVAGLSGTAIAALGTDGIDGNSNAAGAIIDGNTEARAKRRRLDVQDFLARNDSYRFFRKLNDNLMTGRTGTNVGDLYLLVRRE
jgi:glycerate-2-kinase